MKKNFLMLFILLTILLFSSCSSSSNLAIDESSSSSSSSSSTSTSTSTSSSTSSRHTINNSVPVISLPPGSGTSYGAYPTTDNIQQLKEEIKSALVPKKKAVFSISDELVYNTQILESIAFFNFNYNCGLNAFRTEEEKASYVKENYKTYEEMKAYCEDFWKKVIVTCIAAKNSGISVTDAEISEFLNNLFKNNKEYGREVFDATLEAYSMSEEEYTQYMIPAAKIELLQSKYFRMLFENFTGSQEEAISAYQEHIQTLVDKAQIVYF